MLIPFLPRFFELSNSTIFLLSFFCLRGPGGAMNRIRAEGSRGERRCLGDAMNRVRAGGDDVEDGVEMIGHQDEGIKGDVGIVPGQCAPLCFSETADL